MICIATKTSTFSGGEIARSSRRNGLMPARMMLTAPLVNCSRSPLGTVIAYSSGTRSSALLVSSSSLPIRSLISVSFILPFLPCFADGLCHVGERLALSPSSKQHGVGFLGAILVVVEDGDDEFLGKHLCVHKSF